MSTLGWVLIVAGGLAGWLAIAIAVAKWLGRTVRVRDRQIPRD